MLAMNGAHPETHPDIQGDFEQGNKSVNNNEERKEDDITTKTPEDPAVTSVPIEEPSISITRGSWDNPCEFLMSCIAMSVGLGNIWRFPYVAYKNGGGAFLVPYLIALLFIGKPLYFLEMVLGQFSSLGSVKVWEMVPFLKGVGYCQALSTWFIGTYYCVIIAITLHYFISSFLSVLPWTVCNPSWPSFENCFSNLASNITNVNATKSSTELYFSEGVIKAANNIDDGIGSPDSDLVICLLLAWIIITIINIRGTSISGKVAYFTAIFPYAIMFTLLIRGVTLEGASTGILYYLRPDWSKLLEGNTWYAAVVQCFYSLSIGSGPIVTYSSYNPFKHNIYRDAWIICLVDSFTSFLAGITIFAILGNLAHVSGRNIADVVTAGPGMAFISYPDAVSKFEVVPQLFSVLFFLMLITLGIGSCVALVGCIVAIICDGFPNFKRLVVVLVVCSIGFVCGLVYITPGGMMILDIVDYFGGGFLIFFVATIETLAVCWIYGLRRFLRDIHLMLDIRLSIYWKVTWAYIVPCVLLSIFTYSMIIYKPLGQGDYIYPTKAIAAGWCLAAFAIIQIPIWAIYVISKQPQDTWLKRLASSLQETERWRPKDPAHHEDWIEMQQQHPQDGTKYLDRLWCPRTPSNQSRSATSTFYSLRGRSLTACRQF